MDAHFLVGPQTKADGALSQPRLSRDTAVVTVDGHAHYREANSRGNVFFAASQAALALGAGLSATSVWSLYNPIGSGVNIDLLDILVAFAAAPAAAAVVFLASPGSQNQAAPTAATLLASMAQALIGLNTGFASSGNQPSKGKVFTAATLAAVPIIARILGSVVAVGGITPPMLADETAGRIILAPGGIITLQASAAASVFASMTWEEVPILV